MPTENMCITIPDWIHNWIKSQPGKKSTVVTEILKQHIVANAERKPVKIPLVELKGDEYDDYMTRHMAKLNADLDRMQELEFSS
jgi:hypothetical protein